MALRKKPGLRTLVLALAPALWMTFFAGAAFAQTFTPLPAAQPPPLSSPSAAGPTRPLDLVATITLATGKSETFAREIDRLEIITRPGGAIEMVHLVLATDGSRNTHIWYNYSQVAKLSYRFVTPEGSSKVYVRLLQESPATSDLTERLEPLSPREYR